MIAPAPGGLASLAAAITRLEATGAPIHQAGLEHPTLDEVFGSLTGDPGPQDTGSEDPGCSTPAALTASRPATPEPADWRPPRHDRAPLETLTPASRARFALTDAVAATRRYLLRSMRQPDIVIGGLLMPVVFVLLFGYVFGSSIHVPGGNYRAYLMSGLFAQSTLFASASVAVAVATDMSEGVIDRFKSLPITGPRC